MKWIFELRVTAARTPMVSILLHIIIILLIDESRHVLAVDYPITSTKKVEGPDGSELGPALELSATILETGQTLHYICRENGPKEGNLLGKKLNNGVVEKIAPADHDGGRADTELCGTEENDPNYHCTVNKGSVEWERDFGGRYCCLAFPDQAYYIHWINPVTRVPNSVDLEADRYGSTLTFYCAVEMTPVDISYQGILNVEWVRQSRFTRGSWASVVSGENDINIFMANQGPNNTLEISNYNPIKHGGEYRCTPSVTGYGNIEDTGSFLIKSKPTVKVTNDLRHTFEFGLHEEVTFRCEAQSYPFPELLEFKIDGRTVNPNFDGVTDKEDDTISVTGLDKHFVKFTVSNMSEVFRNDSVLQCVVVRPDKVETVDVQRIILREIAPPTIPPTDSSGGVHPGGGGKQRQEELSPWIVAVAVIIPLLVILVIIVLLVYRYRRQRDNRGIYMRGKTAHPDA